MWNWRKTRYTQGVYNEHNCEIEEKQDVGAIQESCDNWVDWIVNWDSSDDFVEGHIFLTQV